MNFQHFRSFGIYRLAVHNYVSCIPIPVCYAVFKNINKDIVQPLTIGPYKNIMDMFKFQCHALLFVFFNKIIGHSRYNFSGIDNLYIHGEPVNVQF